MADNKDPLLANKYISAVIGAALLAMVLGALAALLYKKHEPAEHAWSIAPEQAQQAGTETAAAAEPAALEPVGPMLAAADVASGQNIAKRCAACHSFDKGGPAKVGPPLYDIVGHAKAASEVYAAKYSSALKSAGGSWTYEDLNAFLHSPKTDIPGTTMGFAGLKKPQERADIIAWLRTLSDAPVALP